jgi:hypothetical protein
MDSSPLEPQYGAFSWVGGYGVRKVLLGLRPKPRQGAEPLGTCNGFDVFVNEPGTDNIRFLEKWGPAPPFFVPATYHFVSLL